MEAGLESVIAAHTVLSDVDGEAGRLVLRGATLESLAGVASFEEVCARLWSGLAPVRVDDLRAALGAARVWGLRPPAPAPPHPGWGGGVGGGWGGSVGLQRREVRVAPEGRIGAGFRSRGGGFRMPRVTKR